MAGGGNLSQFRRVTARGREDKGEDKGRRGQPLTRSESHCLGIGIEKTERLAGATFSLHFDVFFYEIYFEIKVVYLQNWARKI